MRLATGESVVTGLSPQAERAPSSFEEHPRPLLDSRSATTTANLGALYLGGCLGFALLYAVANALETLAEREKNTELKAYSNRLKAALIETVAQGYITADLKGKTKNPEQEKIVDMYGFIDHIERNLASVG